jgi:hypothetical protein
MIKILSHGFDLIVHICKQINRVGARGFKINNMIYTVSVNSIWDESDTVSVSFIRLRNKAGYLYNV